MITLTSSPSPSPLEPKSGDAFTFAFSHGQGNEYTCLVGESGRVMVIGVQRRGGQVGWDIGHVSTLGETWNALAVQRLRLFTKVGINLEA